MEKNLRIKRSEEFQTIIEKKRSDLNKEYVVYHQKKECEQSRAGISVGKKLGNAVFRNKAKRQVRMMLQEILKNDYSFDCVIIVRHGYFKADFESNLKSLENHLNKIEKRRYSNETV